MCLLQNSSDDFQLEQDYTYKHFYYPESDGKLEKEQPQKRKHISQEINAFFDTTPMKKKICSTVGQSHTSGGVSYISTNKEDTTNATHLMKIEIFDLRKLAKISDERQHWKHADVRVKYYVNDKDENNHYLQTKEVIYKITKEIAETEDCKKYHFNSE